MTGSATKEGSRQADWWFTLNPSFVNIWLINISMLLNISKVEESKRMDDKITTLSQSPHEIRYGKTMQSKSHNFSIS